MLFKPNFCCNCGVKIERAEWSVLTSRRFCPVCADENKGVDWIPRLVVLLGVVAGIFGTGVYIGRGGQPQIQSSENAPERKLVVGAKQQPGIKDEERTSPPAPQAGPAPVGVPDVVAAGDTKDQPSRANTEAVYYCGALTKKGKPCSRRVRSSGRCWQHKGQPVALVSQSEPDVY